MSGIFYPQTKGPMLRLACPCPANTDTEVDFRTCPVSVNNVRVQYCPQSNESVIIE
ncbi:12473_t:CDS:2 [Ambispora gerdemannii]|uniref:12473_t:CDS:1 n=1 Tax=Ambispora gerdemannii TaxID=144530 RepID=A0A9N9B428_9GLOM|nr:12473_t:CDS:2 [Ambispora gerdemannii]